MSKREKIILIVTLVVVAYALLDFLVLSKIGKEPAAQLQAFRSKKETAEFSSHTMAQISRIEMQAKKYQGDVLVSKIESDWPKDPFLVTVKEKKNAVPKLSPVSGLRYTGFMQLGSNSFAIINGMEYKEGETVLDTGFKVSAILPKKVELRRGGEKAEIYLEEN